MKIKKLLILFIFVFVAVGLVACGGSDEELDGALNELDEALDEDVVEDVEEDVEEDDEEWDEEYEALVREDLINYVNVGMEGVAEYRNEILAAYNSVVGDNFTDDQTTYDMLVEEVIPAIISLEEGVAAIATETEEVAYLHEVYMKSLEVEKSAYAMMVYAIENASPDDMAEGSEGVQIAQEQLRGHEELKVALGTDVGLEFQ